MNKTVLTTLALLFFYAFQIQAQTTYIIPDLNFRACLQEKYPQIMNGDQLILSEAALVVEINCFNRNISSIEGLQYFTSLKRLLANRNQISDISQLQGFTQMTILRVDENMLTDVSVIEVMPNLGELSIGKNQLTEIPDFTLFPNLIRLSIGGNQWSTSTLDLSALPNLGELNLASGGFEAIIFPSTLDNLFSFIAERNKLTSLSGLENATALRTLRMEGNKLNDLSFMSNLNELVRLDLRRNQLTSVPDFSAFPNLYAAHIGYNPFIPGQTLDLSVNSSLQELLANDLDLNEIAGLGNLPSLRLFQAANNQLASLDGLVNATGLTQVKVEGNSLTFGDLEPFSQVANFTYTPQSNAGSAQELNVLEGDSLVISLDLGGSQTLYQWSKDGVDIVGANDSSLIIPVVSLIDSGSYILTATNALLPGLTIQSEIIDVSVTKNSFLIPDPNLEAEVRLLINKPAGDIYKTDVENITSLNLNAKNVADIEGLQHFTSLSNLNLYNNQVSDTSPLDSLTNLKTLNLRINQITDISNLSGLTNLTSLSIGQNPISDISILSGFVDLQYLSSAYSQISDISALSNLTKLTWLFLDGNQISDITPLANLTNLKYYLGLSSNQITDLSALSGLTNLAVINLRINQFTNISDLSSLTNLTNLQLGQNQISDISALAGMSNLNYLMLSYAQISDLNPLAGLTDLTFLDLKGNQITEINALSGLVNLKTLYLGSNQITDFTPTSTYYDNLTAKDFILNFIPVADAGVDQVINVLGSTVVLDGTQSSDADEDVITYQWTIITKPQNSQANLINDITATPSFNVDISGIYTFSLTVSDPFLESVPDTVIVSVIPPLEIDSLSSPTGVCGFNIGCNGESSAISTVFFQGGQGPYNILWSDGQTTAMSSSLSAGNYTVTITDFLGNMAAGSIDITEATSIELNYTTSGVTCENSANAAIDLIVSGGCAPHVFNWTGPDGFSSSAEDIETLVPGDYSVNVTDNQGCQMNSETITIGSLSSPEVEIVGGKAVFFGYAPNECVNLSLNISGGAAPYMVQWESGQLTNDITVCPEENSVYSVVVTDANGCTSLANAAIPVIDVRCGKNLDKIKICHTPKGNSSDSKTLCVSANAVASHLNNGDYLGGCNGTDAIDGYLPYSVNIFPNPFETIATVEYEVLEEGNVSIAIYNSSGTLLDSPVNGSFLSTGKYQFEFDRTAYTGNVFYVSVLYQGHETMSNTYTLIGH